MNGSEFDTLMLGVAAGLFLGIIVVTSIVAVTT